jgi:hypothetical protein
VTPKLLAAPSGMWARGEKPVASTTSATKEKKKRVQFPPDLTEDGTLQMPNDFWTRAIKLTTNLSQDYYPQLVNSFQSTPAANLHPERDQTQLEFLRRAITYPAILLMARIPEARPLISRIKDKDMATKVLGYENPKLELNDTAYPIDKELCAVLDMYHKRVRPYAKTSASTAFFLDLDGTPIK